MTRRLLILVMITAWVALIALIINPVSSSALRGLFLLAMAGVWLSTMLVIWRWKPLRIVWACVPIVVVLPFLLPGRPIAADELRAGYVERMERLEGARYFWGGECPWGIDCSGLPRYALRQALLSQGIRTFNGRATRMFLEQWWFDASAQALGEGYRDYTEPLPVKGTIRSMDYEGLLPGDLAVTQSGVHILAYLGDGRWIQADPGPMSVTILDGRADANTWFQQPVTTHRWSVLAK